MRPLCSSDESYLFCCLLLGGVWLQEFDEILKGTSAVVVLHLTTGWEEFEGWEALDLDILELVGSGIRLGNDDVGVILKKKLLKQLNQLFQSFKRKRRF